MGTDPVRAVSCEEIRRIGICASVHGAPYIEQLWTIYECADDEETRRCSFEMLASLPVRALRLREPLQ